MRVILIVAFCLVSETLAWSPVGVVSPSRSRLQSKRLPLTALRGDPESSAETAGFKVTDVGAASASADPSKHEDVASAQSGAAQEAAPGSIFAQRPLTSESLSDRVTELKTSDDPKQTRVILYILVSLVPVLFLVPLMLGRELVPLDTLPPVEL